MGLEIKLGGFLQSPEGGENPVHCSCFRVGLGNEELKRRQRILQSIAWPGTTVECTCVPEGPEAVRTIYDGYKAAPYLIRDIIKAEEEGYDAVIIGGASLGIDGAREQVKIPVIGPVETSMVIASLLGRRFSIVTLSGRETQEDLAYRTGEKFY